MYQKKIGTSTEAAHLLSADELQGWYNSTRKRLPLFTQALHSSSTHEQQAKDRRLYTSIAFKLNTRAPGCFGSTRRRLVLLHKHCTHAEDKSSWADGTNRRFVLLHRQAGRHVRIPQPILLVPFGEIVVHLFALRRQEEGEKVTVEVCVAIPAPARPVLIMAFYKSVNRIYGGHFKSHPPLCTYVHTHTQKFSEASHRKGRAAT